jgi:hypothetical protein
MLLNQLLRPFGYLVIRHPYKWVVDWFYPTVLSVVAVVLAALAGDITKVITPGGMISLALSFIQSLPGFYIAALAAIATFGRADIDSILPEPTPRIKNRVRNTDNWVALTRRRFLAMLFAFLTAESILLILYSICLLSYGPLAASLAYGTALITALVFIYFLLLFQMIAATFWGLYYLGYKLHE